MHLPLGLRLVVHQGQGELRGPGTHSSVLVHSLPPVPAPWKGQATKEKYPLPQMLPPALVQQLGQLKVKPAEV